MAIQSISSVVNSTFIRTFQGLAGGSASQNARSGGVSLSTGLRLGARTFAAAVQSLNTTIGIVNVAEDTLKKLSKLADEMIDVAERGTKLSAGTATRRGLQFEYEDLVTKFRKIVDSSELQSVEYLTKNGLSDLFQKIGLDKSTSDGVATILQKFITGSNDEALASEGYKGKRPAEIPVLKRDKVAKISTSINTNDYLRGAVAPDYSVYEAGLVDAQAYFVSPAGEVSAQTGLTVGQSLMAVNETKDPLSGLTSGYTVVTSTQNFTGDNPSSYQQLFLLSPDGNVVRQVTNNTTAESYLSAAISADNLTVAYGSSDGGTYHFKVVSVAGISDPPASLNVLEDIVLSNYIEDVRISNDGQYANAREVGGANTFAQVGVGSDGYLTSTFGSYTVIGFTDSDTIALIDGTQQNIYSYQYASGAESFMLNDSNITAGAVLENDSTYTSNDGTAGSHNNIAIAWLNSIDDNSKLTVATYDTDASTLKTRYRHNLGEGDVSRISIAYQNDLNLSKDRIDVGVVGSFPNLLGHNEEQLYRFSESRSASNNSLFSSVSEDPTEILDGNLLTRADSYRLLGDLKALKSQMKDNLRALDQAREYISTNVEFVRAAGFAFLDISDQLSGSEDADQVASLVAEQIRQNATTAQMAQIENLRNITSKAVELLT